MIGKLTWSNIWSGNILSWYETERFYLYMPTSYTGVALFDRDFFSPALGIEFPSDEFIHAKRFAIVYLVLIIIVACLAYVLSRRLSLGILPSLVAAVYIGLIKGWRGGDGSMSLAMVTPFILIYGICALLFFISYLKSGRRLWLLGYMISFLLLVLASEFWVNYLAFIVLFSLLVLIKDNPWKLNTIGLSSVHKSSYDFRKSSSWTKSAIVYIKKRIRSQGEVVLFGILIPVLIFLGYFIIRYQVIHDSVLSKNYEEDSMVFTYPSKSLMLEEMVVNASLHIRATVESLIFPWRPISRAVIANYDIHSFNPPNAGQDPIHHYLSLTDWYSGLLFGFFLCVTVWTIRKIKDKEGFELYVPGIGLIFTYTGFLVHMPIRYLAYFSLPGYIGLLDYKHIYSVLGFSILVGWWTEIILFKIKNRFVRTAFVICLVLWIAYCNYSKIRHWG